jgi:hypothetical protein
MGLSFKNLKSASLAPTDKITKGKYLDCRVCDVVDDFHYLLWAHSNGVFLLSKESMQLVQAKKDKYEAEIHYEQEIKPYEDLYDDVPY